MEKLDVYDKNRRKTDKVVERGVPLTSDEFKLVIHVCIINSDNKMLIQQRQSFKEGWPNMWDLTVGGSVIAGETSSLGAARELFEEIGYKIDGNVLRPIFTVNFKGGFDDYYVINADVKLKELSLQISEVKGVKWATKEEILQGIVYGEFIPYHKSIIEMIFDMKSTFGAHRIVKG